VTRIQKLPSRLRPQIVVPLSFSLFLFFLCIYLFILHTVVARARMRAV